MPDSKLNILIIDDSVTIRNLLRKHLEEEFQVDIVEAVDGKEALNTAFTNPFDIIITDIQMPALDGISLCRLLKRNEATKDTPVIIVSTLDTDEDIDKGIEAGAQAYIPKPFTKEKLLDTIRDALDLKVSVKGKSILLVDDSTTIQKVMKNGLLEDGYEVFTATNGKDALGLLDGIKPDLIISDVNMPEMDGVEFCERVKASEKLADVPFLVMSANRDQNIMRNMLGKGAVGYLVKPFTSEYLCVLVEKYLSDHYISLMKEKKRADREKKMMLDSITSLAKALDARDAYTQSHSEDVSQLACLIAMEMGLSDEEIYTLRIGGQLHDIGKIGIPDSVLLKPGKLSDDEFATIKKHPEIGAEILDCIESLGDARQVVRHHHERFDGNGYPDRIGSKDIPLMARILAVADVYHALVSDRPYRKGMPVEKARSIIEEGRGTHFCPDCVSAFFSIKNLKDN